MKDKVHRIGSFLIIDIDIPIYTNGGVSGVAINKEYVTAAIKESKYLVVRTPTGEEIFYPKSLNKIKPFPKVFKRPTEPMMMIPLQIPHKEHRPREFYEVS